MMHYGSRYRSDRRAVPGRGRIRVAAAAFNALIATMFLYEWNLLDMAPQHLSVPKLLGLGLAAYAVPLLAYRVSQRYTVPKRIIVAMVPALVFHVFELLSATAAGNDVAALIDRQVGSLIWLMLPLLFIDSQGRLRKAMVAYCIMATGVHAGILLTGYGIIDLEFGRLASSQASAIGWLGATRSAGFLVNYGDVAIVTAFAVPWLVGVASGRLNSSGLARITAAGALLLMAFGGLVSLSRNVWLTGLVALASYAGGYLGFHRTRQERVARMSILVVVTVLALPLAWRPLKSLYEFAMGVRQASVASRVDQYAAAVDALLASPLTGPGPEFMYDGFAIHNLPLNALIHAGVGGIFLIALLAYLGATLWRHASRRESQEVLAVAAGYTGVLVAVMFYPVIGNSAPLFWATCGLAAAGGLSHLTHESGARAWNGEPEPRWMDAYHSFGRAGTTRLSRSRRVIRSKSRSSKARRAEWEV